MRRFASLLLLSVVLLFPAAPAAAHTGGNMPLGACVKSTLLSQPLCVYVVP